MKRVNPGMEKYAELNLVLKSLSSCLAAGLAALDDRQAGQPAHPGERQIVRARSGSTEGSVSGHTGGDTRYESHASLSSRRYAGTA